MVISHFSPHFSILPHWLENGRYYSLTYTFCWEGYCNKNKKLCFLHLILYLNQTRENDIHFHPPLLHPLYRTPMVEKLFSSFILFFYPPYLFLPLTFPSYQTVPRNLSDFALIYDVMRISGWRGFWARNDPRCSGSAK